MKHLLTTIFMVFLSFTTMVVQGQTTKAEKEANLQAAFKAAELTPNEQELVRTSNAAKSANNKILKADASLSEADVKAKSKEFSVLEDEKLKAAFGNDKYRAFKDAQKLQRKDLSTEEREKIKQKGAERNQKTADLKEACKLAGLSAEQEELIKTSYDARSANNKVLKADASLSQADVKAKAKEFSKAEDNKLKSSLGSDKYKKFKDAQKTQRKAISKDEKTDLKIEKEKERKEAEKARKEANMQEAFTIANFTSAEKELVINSNSARNDFKKALKANSSLTEDDITVKTKAYTDSQNEKLKETIGEEKYKKYKDTLKELNGDSK